MNEQWKDIPGYEGIYAISDQARIVRLSPTPSETQPLGRILKCRTQRKGYQHVHLCRNGVIVDRLLHRLVLLAFVGEPSDAKMQVNHKNGNKSDNRLENLEWVTQSQNIRHALDHLGHKQQGASHHSARLTEKDVIEIRKMAEQGITNAEIARTYDMTRKGIAQIVNRQSWRSVKQAGD